MTKLHKIDREKLAEVLNMRRKDMDAYEFDLLKESAQNWLTITDPGFHPDKKMTEAALPWLTQWKHMNGTTKMDALRQAFKAMIAKAGE